MTTPYLMMSKRGRVIDDGEAYILCACILHYLCVGHPFSILVLYLTFSVDMYLIYLCCGHVLLYIYICVMDMCYHL